MHVNLFDLATKQSQWLSVRQSAIAGNIANVNTPGFMRSRSSRSKRCWTDPVASGDAGRPSRRCRDRMPASRSAERADGPRCMPSKNTVVLENELMEAGEVRRAFELNTASSRRSIRMTMIVSKG